MSHDRYEVASARIVWACSALIALALLLGLLDLLGL